LAKPALKPLPAQAPPSTTTEAAHMPKSQRKHQQWTPGRVKNWAQDIGPNVLLWADTQLKSKAHPDLMEIMDYRHGQTSMLIISQLPTDQWYLSIGEYTLADTILDLLMHNAHRLQLMGESMRKLMGKLTDDEHLG
jgi:hypothetical protein